MSTDPVEARLFAYQVGFGDCFLLRFSYDDGSRRHVLVDFGTTSLPDNASPDHMTKVANDIATKCGEPGGDGLDVVVATHRHADHISGFATRSDGQGTGDVIAGLKPKLVIQPWTEAPNAPVDWEGPESDDSKALAFARHRQSLQSMHEAAGHALRYLKRAGNAVPNAIAGQIAFIGEDNLANKSAVDNLANMGGRYEYVFHGCTLNSTSELPGVTIDVLGPPTLRQTETIRKQRSRDREEFWQMSARRMNASANASDSPLFPDAPSVPGTKMLAEYRWLQRRMDAANAEVVLGLVRALDKQMNNTSVILVLRAGNKTMLLPGDAQLENWQYALQSPLAALLEDVDLLKVGHHGSLNATPKSMLARLRKRGPKNKRGRLTSVVSTKRGKHGDDEKHTEVPRATLIAELNASSTLYSTETLGAKLYEEIVIQLR